MYLFSPVHLFGHLNQFRPILFYLWAFYFIIWVITLFCCSNCSSSGHGELFQLAPVPLVQHARFSVEFVLLGPPLLWVRPVQFFPSPRISYFSKEPWLFLLETSVRGQGLGTRCAHCYWDVITSRSCQPTAKLCACALIHVYTHLNQ